MDIPKTLDEFAAQAKVDTEHFSITDKAIASRIEYVCKCLSNRAGVRLILSCMVAKLHNPAIDPREPVEAIGSATCFSGRVYDEKYLTAFVSRHKLPCNPTTAFLTPALRNLDRPFLVESIPVGTPKQMYVDSFGVLDDVARGRVTAEAVILDSLRWLFLMRAEQEQRMASLLEGIEACEGVLPPSSEALITLLEQHVACKNSSRLPVLGVAAAYAAVAAVLGERALTLKGHNSADEQTGALGDVEVCLASDDNVVTAYEMKKKAVTTNDIDRAVAKIAQSKCRIDNYIFITTDGITDDVQLYAKSFYEQTQGTEIVVLGYIGFIRHFLHFFHRYRAAFLDSYQALVLAEPPSAVPQSLKEAFLALRRALIADESIGEE